MIQTQSSYAMLAVFMLSAIGLNAQDLGIIEPYLILGGTQGDMIEQFNEPDAVAFMHDGRLLAGDTQNGRFKIYHFSKHSLSITAVGSPGSGDCQFDNSLEVVLPNGRRIYNEVQGIACNSKDDIYVVDQGNRRIQVFDSTGTCLPERMIDLDAILVDPDPDEGTTYTSIQGLTIDAEDNIYLTDTGTRRVYKFRPDGLPDSVFVFQAKNSGDYILNDPESMVIYGDQLLIADEGNQNIKIFDRHSGEYSGKLIGHPDLFGRDVEGLAIHGDHLFALNEEFGQIVVFALDEDRTPVLGRFGQKGLNPGHFLSADGMAISDDGRYLAVADQGNFRIQIFIVTDILERIYN